MRKILFVIALWAVAFGGSLTPAAADQRSWRETADETVYEGKYSNCDYGYYVLLPRGVIGHRGKAPSSNHGIDINLANPGSTDKIPSSLLRYVQVYNAYNVGDTHSVFEIVQEQQTAQREIHKNAVISEPIKRTLGGLPAMEFTSTFEETGTKLIERDVVAYRPEGNILYHLQLVSTPETAAEDGKVFDTVVNGFHLTKLPIGVCSND